MTVHEIVAYPAPVLLQKAAAVTEAEFGPSLLALISDMAETMYVSNGIGLAAPQIQISKRILVIDVEWPDREDSNLYAIINPEIVDAKGEIVFEEGCLSFPDLTVPVQRHAELTLRAQDPSGKPFEIQADGLLSICIQHEMDHLDGITLVDRARGDHRVELIRQLKEQPWFLPELLPPDVSL
ncbi:MAG: peptide deformylase [Myxococcales bacterium]|nr:peptide deformylase [Myxococcales bacterium]|tara:strand:+ start:176 stop:721 length:546 start_codon:yes stop_codon:yes gene_type:complete